MVERNLRRADALVDDLRSLALSDEWEVTLVPLRRIVEDVVLEVRSAAEHAGVSLRIPEDIPDVQVDASRTTLALMNLTWNAIRYHDPEKSDRWAEIRVQPDERAGSWRVTVADNGVGVPEALRSRIFDRFFRAHANVPGGSGLGLYLVRAITELGGDVWVESTPDVGTRFHLRIPEAEAA